MRVVHADGHRLMLNAVRERLAGSGFELVGVTCTGAALLPLVGQLEPELVLLELRLPGRDGYSCLRWLRERRPELRLIVLSGDDSPAEIEQALAAGADGFISKQTEPAELSAALQAILAGEETVFSEPERADAASRARELGLSEREFEILSRVALGQSNKQISEGLFVTEQTVKFHLTNLYRKTRTANRTAAARYAAEHGLIDNRSLSSPVQDGRLTRAAQQRSSQRAKT
jgi:two-component system nitrate/nitrite response regulator NarP